MSADGSAGVGLHSMRERAQELGGTLSILSNQPHGVTVTVVFQVNSNLPEALK
ncbi:MAG: hypothetical protein GY805_09835 [Chloroflexi bacterium]|nr:hypothetical protein [Chloroflexota bacterium]